MVATLCFAFLGVARLIHATERFQDPADSIVRVFARKYHVPGIAYAILKDGSTVSRGQFGVANVDTKEPISAISVFPIASLSKPFVALGVLSLVEKGLVRLSDPVGTYLPKLPEDWKKIPVSRLLDHTSGVPDHYNAGKWDVLGPDPISSDGVVEKLVSMPLEFPIGTKYKYSNGNYVLLAKVIEAVSRMPYADFLDQKVFKVLGMKNTKVLVQEDLSKVVQGYAAEGTGVRKARWNPDWCYGNGQIGSTPADLSRLDTGLYTERVVKFSTLAAITTPQPLSDGTLPNYAMGWAIGATRGTLSIGHDGKIEGWRSEFIRFTKFNLTVIVVSNSGTARLDVLATDLAGTVERSLSLQPIPDDYPEITKLHRGFIQAIVDGKVNPSWLSPGLRSDFEQKDHWHGIGKMFESTGPIALFQPCLRERIGAENRVTYRVECGQVAFSVLIGWDDNGFVRTLLIR